MFPSMLKGFVVLLLCMTATAEIGDQVRKG